MPRCWTMVVGLIVVACAHPPVPGPVAAPPPPAVQPELVVILPEPGGSPLTVQEYVRGLRVTIGGTDQLLDRAYAAVHRSPDGRVEVAQRSPAEVEALFSVALAARPARPKTFLLFFTLGTDTLTSESAQSVEKILTEVARAPAPEVMVVGHADRTGTERENDLLSVKRAERVRQDLIHRGVAAEMVETVGRGARDATGDAAQDRRVDIVVR